MELSIHVFRMIRKRYPALSRFLKHRMAVLGLIWMTMVVLAAVVGNTFIPWAYDRIDLRHRNEPPSTHHLLGTDALGRDVLSRLVRGARVSLQVVIISVAGSLLIGTAIGTGSAMLGGVVDIALQRFTEVIMSVPLLVIALVFMAFLKPGLWPLVVVMALFGWTDTARVVRGELLSVREEQYIEAARALGFGLPRIALKHALPACLPSLMVNATLKAANFILIEASMSFLGFGVQPPTPSWGLMLAEAQEMEVLTKMPWLWISPGVAITFTVLALNFLGDGLRDAFSPKEKYTVI